MSALFEAYVTNLGKYNEGELVGEYLKFPTTPEEVQALLKRIGIDGVRYEEIFITDFDGDVLGLYDHLGEYENIDELTLSIVRTGSNTPPAFPNPPRRSCWSAWSCSAICALRSILCPKRRAAGWTPV